MSDPRETEQRLRNWLDSNQAHRERLCLHLLPLFGDYSNVKPRRPKGGPDGAHDIEALYKSSILTWGAIGFKNSANDSLEHKKWVKKKFLSDLESALRQKPNLPGFVFFTNVDLTPTEQQELLEKASKMGIKHSEIYYRERLRQVLDSTEGLGYRLQYLNIEMTLEEQIAFINRLESTREKQLRELAIQQETVDRKLQRIEFLNDCLRPIHTISGIVLLKKPYTPEELGHFRVAFELKRIYDPSPWSSLFIGGRDSYWESQHDEKHCMVYGSKSVIWSKEPEELLQNKIYTQRTIQTNVLKFTGQLYRRGPFETLGEFDRIGFDIFVTEPLLEVIATIGLVVNNYAVLDIPKELLVTAEEVGLAENNPPKWPDELKETESMIEWKRLYIRSRDTDNVSVPPPRRHVSREIHFSEFTPEKLDIPAKRGGSMFIKANAEIE